jgi:hypothetical protein
MLDVVYAEFLKNALYAECHYAECRYAECRGAVSNILNLTPRPGHPKGLVEQIARVFVSGNHFCLSLIRTTMFNCR